MIIGHFGTDQDKPFVPRYRELVGAHTIKWSSSPERYFTSFALKVRNYQLDAVICTCPVTLVTLLKALPDFKHPLDKRGLEKKLTLNDYAGSLITIPGHRLGTEKDLEVLFMNPLEHIVTKGEEGKFVFRRFLTKLTQPEKWPVQTQFTWELWTPATSSSLLAKFSEAKALAVDIETYPDDPLRQIHCVGYCALFADGTTHAVVVPFKDMLAHQFVRDLNASAPLKILQGGGYDNVYFMRWGVPLYNYLCDTLQLFHAWYSELPKRLDFITAFTVRNIRYWKDDSKTGGEWEVFEYNARDCWATLTAWINLSSEVPQWAWNNYHIQFPLIFPAIHTECDGLKINKKVFIEQKIALELQLNASLNKLESWIGEGFNPRSPDQCKKLLKVLGMGDVDSADEKHMLQAAAVHPLNELIISEILNYRGIAKLLSTYLVEDKLWLDRLFYRTNPAGTETGRLASTESSFWCGFQIQNVPGGPEVKSFIEADDDWDAMGETDYSQSEAYCVAYTSGCTSMIELLNSDKDYHKWNAHKFFGVAYEAITKTLRTLAKRVNHGANYNMGAQVLLFTMGPKAVAEAKRLLDLPAKWTLLQVCEYLLAQYAKTYPEVKKDWYDWIKSTIKMTHKLVSQLGWTRYFFEDPNKSKPALNAAVAHGPQNLSVGIINERYYAVWRESVYGCLKGIVRLKAQIHDSILYCYRGEDTPNLVTEMMKNPKQIRDIKGKVRTMLIPPETNSGSRTWAGLKT